MDFEKGDYIIAIHHTGAYFGVVQKIESTGRVSVMLDRPIFGWNRRGWSIQPDYLVKVPFRVNEVKK
jgi:hypothetical protein